MLIIVEPENEATTLVPRNLLTIFNNLFRSGFSSLSCLEENYDTAQLGLKYPTLSPLVEIFNEKIHQLMDAGLISYWYNKMKNPSGITKKPDEIGPQVLTMDHVTVGFLVCLCPSIMSILMFVCEVAFFRWELWKITKRETTTRKIKIKKTTMKIKKIRNFKNCKIKLD